MVHLIFSSSGMKHFLFLFFFFGSWSQAVMSQTCFYLPHSFCSISSLGVSPGSSAHLALALRVKVISLLSSIYVRLVGMVPTIQLNWHDETSHKNINVRSWERKDTKLFHCNIMAELNVLFIHFCGVWHHFFLTMKVIKWLIILFQCCK